MNDHDQLDSIFDDPLPEGHRSGMIAVVGKPNVGKSTLINRILGQKIAAVSPKPQTTRKRQLGILTDAAMQMVFIDTPGLHLPRHKLGEYMVKIAEAAFRDADVILLLYDVSQPPDRADQHIAETVTRLRGETPVVLALNKADLVEPDQLDAHPGPYTPRVEPTHARGVSALRGGGIDALLADLASRLPEGPRYFPADQVSEVNMRFIAAETIREKVMLYTEEEIPHSVAVEIDSYKETAPDVTLISAVLYVERDSQKGIVIGKGGAMIKRIGTEARQELEAITETRIHLDLRVKVLKDWRRDSRIMSRLGYSVAAEEE